METIKNSQVVGRIRMGLANHPGHTAILAPVSVQHALVNDSLTQEDIDKALTDAIKAKADAALEEQQASRAFDREQNRIREHIRQLFAEIKAKTCSASIDCVTGVDYTYARALAFEIRDATSSLINTFCDGKEKGVITYEYKD